MCLVFQLSEIKHVKDQAEHMNHQLDLLFNPLLVRAVLEIVSAKEVQIRRTYQNGNGDLDLSQFVSVSVIAR